MLSIDMVQLPAGRITLRDDRLGRTWQVDVAAFSIARFPITRSQYLTLIGKAEAPDGHEDCPIQTVSWADAANFCDLLSERAGLQRMYGNDDAKALQRGGFRLPTDAEWEYACRASTVGTRYGPLDEIAWYRGNSGGGVRPVGLKAPNAWGLHDMLGNVWEWCEDLYDPEVYGTYRIFRGGGWADPERGVLATNRRRSHPSFAIDDLGFRIAL